MTPASNPIPSPRRFDQAIIERLARAAGFAQAGIAPVLHGDNGHGDNGDKNGDKDGAEDGQQAGRAGHETYLETYLESYLEAWIARGYAGEMDYLKRRNEAGQLLRSSVTAAVPWARSVIVCAAPYHASDAGAPRSTDPAPQSSGWIARYAWSGSLEGDGTLRPADYHKVLLARLKRLEAALHAELDASGNAEGRAQEAPFRSWAYVDTGPLIERAWARLAGVGWTGKNTCTLNQQHGSFFFLGVILTSLEVAPEARATLAPLAADRCGSCTRCLDACPTDALIAPHQMDASRCISYLTIEKRGSIAADLRPGMGRQIFGCDICQDVCPWNDRLLRRSLLAAAAIPGPGFGMASDAIRDAMPEPSPDPLLSPRAELINPSLAWLARLSEEEFGRLFYGSPVKRAKYSGLRRNIAIAMGNSGDLSHIPQLEQWAVGEDQVLAESSTWALARLFREAESGRS
jgi:epoxyqueuosine reductase